MATAAMETAIPKLNPDSVDNVFVIGDTPNDVRCGKAISATTIAVATAGYTYDDLVSCHPDHVFHDLSDVGRVADLLSQVG